jgi:DNA polymerase-3 subunit alpha
MVKFQENENSSQVSLFESSDVQIEESSLHVRTGALWKTSQRERGRIYISGHPLDDYKFEMKYFVMPSWKH